VLFDGANYLFLFLFCLTVLLPFWQTILLSLSTEEEATSLGFRLWTRVWTLGSYKYAFSSYGAVGTAYLNSVFRTVLGTALVVLFTLLGAYPLSKKDLPGRSFFTVVLLISMFFSGGLIPTYLLIRSLGLLNTRLVLILPGMTSAYYIIIARNFLMTLDRAYEEVAFIDGAGYARILLTIVVPLSTPVIATIALWAGVGHWNAWFDALIYISSESKIVLQLLIRRMLQAMDNFVMEGMLKYQQQEQTRIPTAGVRAAVTILTIGPIILLYPFLQKYFVKGVMVGSLKG